ncbi:MAG: EAL domain-containing protein [Burkholderiaceae bacterium]|nr:EAL domain-containing protein [Burkholderiaceae bacterium]
MRQMLIQALGRLSVGHKLLLIFLLDMTAVAFISGILVQEKFLAIDFARKELAGNAYIDGLRPLLVDLASRPTRIADAAGASAAQARVQALEAGHGEGLAAQQAVADLVAALPEAASAPRRALEAARALLTRVGNQSNLILDPDLDSYYAMSVVLLRLPQLLESIDAMSRHAGSEAAAGPEARTRFLLLEGQLDAAQQALVSDFDEAFAASAAAQAGRPDLRLDLRLQAGRDALVQALAGYRAAARSRIEADRPEPAPLLAAHGRALGALDAAWRDTSAALQDLLQARIGGFFSRMAWHLGTALALLGLILCAVYFVAQQISRPLRRLSAVADSVRRTGDHGLRAQWHSQDEIGRLVNGFNDMLAQLDTHRATQQALAAAASAAQAQQQLVEAIPIPLMVTAVPGHQVLHANGPAQRWLGEDRDDPWRRGLEPALRARFFQQLHDRDAVNEFEVHWQGPREASWAVLSARRLHYQGQQAVLTAFAPINHLKLMERRLELWAKVFEASGEAIVIVDAEQRVLTVNRAFSQGSHYQLSEVIGEPLDCLGSDDATLAWPQAVWAAAQQRGTWQGEAQLQRRDGQRLPVWMMVSAVRDRQQGLVEHYIIALIDISERKRNEERISFLAQHDVLTELPNRSLCVERLRAAVQRAERTGEKVGVLFIDLDRFKTINDSLGHHVGDGLLRSVAQRLLGVVRAGDTVSRLGGDEFVVVLNGVRSVDEIADIAAQRLVPRVREPHLVDGAELHVSCSVGVAVWPDDSRDIDALMRHADAAMYQTKAEGRDGVHFFTPELNDRAQRRLQIESALRHALERQELSLHYQPRVAAQGRQLMGVEALLRWQSAELGSLSPGGFVPVAEESGLIVPIGAWIIDQACRQWVAWSRAGLAVPQVSINVSAVQLRDGRLVSVLSEALARHGCPPQALEVELTESTLMGDAEHLLAQLHAIKSLGVSLAVDDFGTGYSNLAYLQRFPIDRLKVDRSFVARIAEEPSHLAISRAIIGLGHSLGLKVVAEGVEHEVQARALRQAGCDELQGYLYAQPMPAEGLADWLRREAAALPSAEAAAAVEA